MERDKPQRPATDPDTIRSSRLTRNGPTWVSSIPLDLGERADLEELLDQGPHEHDELRRTFRDMRRVNRWLGGAEITVRGVQRLTGHLQPGDELAILDIGAGHADIPRVVMAWAAKRQLRCRAFALDLDFATVISGLQDPANQDIEFIQGDGLKLPFAGDQVDIAMSSMTLHHFTDDEARVSLQEMARVSRLGIVVNDLSRAVHGYVVAWLLARLATRSFLTRHDAHRSIRRSRTIPEMRRLAEQAGLGATVFDSVLGYRVAMTAGVRPW